MIVRTPKLKRGKFELASKSSGRNFFCLDLLEKLVCIPNASAYWAEASDKQWPDGSGLRAQVKLGDEEFPMPMYKTDGGSPWLELLPVCARYLKKLGCEPGGPPKTIYFRLLYED